MILFFCFYTSFFLVYNCSRLHGLVNSCVHFQVQNIFKRQNESKRSKGLSHHPPKLTHKKSNLNNSSSNKSAKNKGVKTVEPKKAGPNIFVWGSPDPVQPQESGLPANQPPSLATNSATVEEPRQKDEQKAQIDSPSMKLNKNENNSDSNTQLEKETCKELNPGLSSSTLKSPEKFRSVTPTPTSSDTPSVSQQRRSKTPTPAMNKEMLRAHQTTTSLRGSRDLKARPTSAYFASASKTTTTNSPSTTSVTAASTTVKSKPATPGGYPYPYSYPSWGNPASRCPNFSPAIMPKEYYEQFYRWIQYYASLSPEQQKSFLPYNGNPISVSLAVTKPA